AAAPAVTAAETGAHDRHDARRLALVDRRGVERGAALGAGGVLEHLDPCRGRLGAHGARVLLAPAPGGDQRGGGRRHRDEPAGHAGSSSENVVRPGTLSACSSPAMRSASSWAIARPRPEPWASSEV